jgi:hypothetical protein
MVFEVVQIFEIVHINITVCFTDLGKLNLPMVVGFLVRASFYYCHSCLKKEIRFKSGQN